MEPFRNFAHRPLVRIWLDQGQGIKFFFILFSFLHSKKKIYFSSLELRAKRADFEFYFYNQNYNRQNETESFNDFFLNFEFPI